MPRIIHCSRCGQEGHNRRNRNCTLQRPTQPPSTPPGPPPRFTRSSTPPGPPPAMQPRAHRGTTHRMRTINLLSSAISVLEALERFIPRQNEFPHSDYILGVVTVSIAFCEQINRALESDSVNPNLLHLFQSLCVSPSKSAYSMPYCIKCSVVHLSLLTCHFKITAFIQNSQIRRTQMQLCLREHRLISRRFP